MACVVQQTFLAHLVLTSPPACLPTYLPACLPCCMLCCAVPWPGVKSSGAVVKVFRHNDMAHLEKLLRFHIAEGQARTHRPWKKVRRAGHEQLQ